MDILMMGPRRSMEGSGGAWEEPGGATRRIQQDPGGPRRTQKDPGRRRGPRKTKEDLGGARRI